MNVDIVVGWTWNQNRVSRVCVSDATFSDDVWAFGALLLEMLTGRPAATTAPEPAAVAAAVADAVACMIAVSLCLWYQR